MNVSLYRFVPPQRHTDKHVDDSVLLSLWRFGFDTYDIACRVGIPEHEVANRLPHIRERERQNNQWEGK